MAESSRTFSAKIVVQRARLHRREHCYNHDGNPSQDHSHWLWILKYVKRASYEVLVTTMSLIRKIGTFRPEEDDCMLSLDCSVSCAGRFKLLRAPAVGSKSVPIRALQYLVNRVNLKKSLAHYLWRSVILIHAQCCLLLLHWETSSIGIFTRCLNGKALSQSVYTTFFCPWGTIP